MASQGHRAPESRAGALPQDSRLCWFLSVTSCCLPHGACRGLLLCKPQKVVFQTLSSDLVFSTTPMKYIKVYHLLHVLSKCLFLFPLHFHQAKAKEEKLKKCGEDDETVPSEYRLKPATVPCQPRC